MNAHTKTTMAASACPHDCPSVCALEVEVVGNTIGRVRGAKSNTYTDGVICAKVARYAERLNHPDRLLEPRICKGAKGSGEWGSISWEAALDLIAEKFLAAEAKFGAETVWPYFYAGTMGLVQRDSIQRLRHAKGYSGQFDTICVNNAWTGFSAATGKLMGPDPREMAKADCVVIWGTNAVATQINVMTHAVKARKERGAKIVVIDIYENDTVKQADLGLVLKPGTDAALACAVMHVLFRDGMADREYMSRYSDLPEEFEAHLQSRTPEWAADITGLSVEEIEAFAHLVGITKKSYFRLGYGFTRTRNGAVAMHAATCIPTVTGAWQVEGGGAMHSNADIYGMDSSFIKGTISPGIRSLDQSKIGRILTGDQHALGNGPPVTAMLIQNTNPMNVCPEQALVKQGFAREDLFVVVHEQFMTETAQVADLVLPATMFVEHDDIYRGGGHQHILLGPKLVDAPEHCRENLFVIEELAKRLGVAHQPGFGLSSNELIDDLLRRSNRGTLEDIRRDKWIDCQPGFDTSHYINGFGHADGKFHFKADWQNVPWGRPPKDVGLQGAVETMPTFPDQWDVLEEADSAHPYRLATSPARSFLNSSFSETPSSRKKEGVPKVMMHPNAANREGIAEGERVRLSNERGAVILHAVLFDGLKENVLIAEGLHKNADHEGGAGINTLTGADATAPHGGAAFHDVHVRIERL
ncbi:molybdopterin-dependent oxidoreductase [Pseudahrensia aquimaris]|uniref:Molybdopterin-dependent oxidoreductase n=1 Tax=Pseudahrensia aquimaris TaxID=744461 RepID=A0ABW3FD93_9HYPH